MRVVFSPSNPKGLSMSRSLIHLLPLLCCMLINTSLKCSWFSWGKQDSQTEQSQALTDPSVEKKRRRAFRTLQHHPYLIRHLQDNRDALGLVPQPVVKPTSSPSEASKASAPQQVAQPVALTPGAPLAVGIPQQGPVDLKSFLQTLKHEQEKYPQRPLIVSVNVNNQVLSSDVNAVSKAQTPPTTETETVPPESSSSFTHWSSQAATWARLHKIRCIGYCLCGGWGAIHLYIFFIRRYLNRENAWFRWKNHLNLEELYHLTTTALIKEILKFSASSVLEWRPSLVRTTLNLCTQEIQKELSTLTSYKNFFLCIQSLPFQRLFLLPRALGEELSYRIQRLTYLKSSILSFIKENDLASEQPEASEIAPAAC